MKKDTCQILARNLRHLREAKQLTQRDAAQQLGIQPQAVSRWECGNTLPDVLLLPDIARLYGTSVDELYRESPTAYRTYADKLLAVYEASRNPEDYLIAREAFCQILQSGSATAEDMRGFGVLNQYMLHFCAEEAQQIFADILDGKYPGSDRTLWRTRYQQQLLQHMLGQLEQANAALQKQVSDGQADLQDRLILARGYRLLGRQEQALEVFAQARALTPGDHPLYPELMLLGGDIFRDRKDYSRAFACWEAALARDSTLYDARYSMGFCYEEMGDWQKALAVWQEIAAIMKKEGWEVELQDHQARIDRCRQRLQGHQNR